MGFTFFIRRSKSKEGSIVKLIIWLLTIKTWKIKYQMISELNMWYGLGKFFSRAPTLIFGNLSIKVFMQDLRAYKTSWKFSKLKFSTFLWPLPLVKKYIRENKVIRSSQFQVVFLWIKLPMSCLCINLTPICINCTLPWFVQIDSTLNFHLQVFPNPILKFPFPIFLLGVRECTFVLHSIIKSKITLDITWQT